MCNLYFIFFCFSSYLLVLMEEYLRGDRLASIEAKLDFLIHHLEPRIHNDSVMEQGIKVIEKCLDIYNAYV